jgi:hypothetical protein
MITNDKQIDACLEHICQQGCRVVNHIICQLEQGEYVENIQHLNAEQRQKLYQELKNVMAVYAETGVCHQL